LAVYYGEILLVKILLEEMADTEIGPNNTTPLHIASL
jgi:hypothetical protein